MARATRRSATLLVLALGISGCSEILGFGSVERAAAAGAGGSAGASDGGAGGAGGGGTGGGGVTGACAEGSGVRWIRRFGDASDQQAGAAAPDGEGGVFISGPFHGLMDLGGKVLTSKGNSDLYLARLDADGNHLWSKSFGDAFEQAGPEGWTRLLRAPDGGVIFAGVFQSTVDLGGGGTTAAGYLDAFVARYDPLGNHMWTHILGGTGQQHVHNVAVDGQANRVLAAGFYQEELSLEGAQHAGAGTHNGFLVELDVDDGALLSSRPFGSAGDTRVNDVAVDDKGRVAIVGLATEDLDLGDGVIPKGGAQDGFVALYSEDLTTLVWANRYAASSLNLHGVEFDPVLGQLVVAGSLNGTTTFGSGSGFVTGIGSCLVRLDEAGTTLDVEKLNYLEAVSLVAGAMSETLVSGKFDDSVDFGNGAIEPIGGSDGMIAKLDSKLTTTWTRHVGSRGIDNVHGLAVDPGSNDVFALGYFNGTLAIDGCPVLETAGSTDLLVIRLAP